MSYNEKTAEPKPRTFRLNLTDTDVVEIYKKAGAVGLTPDELLSNFVSDLICGTYTNGSDERMYANEWFDRCMFSLRTEKTFLTYLLDYDSLDEFIDLQKEIFSCKEEIAEMNVSDFDSFEEYESELKYYNDRIENANEDMQEMFNDYCSGNFEHKSFSDEVEIIEDHIKRLNASLNEK